MDLLTAALLAVPLFIATNIDDVFVLLMFFAEPRVRAAHVIAGQFVGIGALVLASVIAGLIALVIEPEYVGLLGLLPIAIGVKKAIDLIRGEGDDTEDSARVPAGSTNVRLVIAVTAITIANGGDNLAVYTPFFATRSLPETVIVAVVFAVMTALWCVIAQWMVNHRTLGLPIRRYGQPLMPAMLIGIGVFILYDAGSFGLLHD